MGIDGILRATLSGNLEGAALENFRSTLAPILAAATSSDPLRVILLMNGLGSLSSAARRFLTELGGDPRIGALAFMQPPRRARVLAIFILKATGKSNIRLFADENEAVAWLKMNVVNIPSA